MGGIFEVSDLQARKRALVAESEVYRESLRLQLQNVRIYGASVRRRLAFFSVLNPILLVAGPIIATIMRRREKRRLGVLGLAFKGFQLYRRFGPALKVAAAQYLWRRRQRREMASSRSR